MTPLASSDAAARLADFCRLHLDLAAPPDPAAPVHDDLILCVMEAVGLGRGADRAAMRANYAAWRGDDRLPLARFVRRVETEGGEAFSAAVGGEAFSAAVGGDDARANAVFRFARALLFQGVHTTGDIARCLRGNAVFEREVAAIPGLGRGDALRTFYFLCGASELAKPDREAGRVLERAVGRPVAPLEGSRLISETCRLLLPDFPALTPRALEVALWHHGRNTPPATPRKPAGDKATGPVRPAVARPVVSPPVAPTPDPAPPVAASAPETTPAPVDTPEVKATPTRRPRKAVIAPRPAPADGETLTGYHTRILEMPADERPRERLLLHGADAVSLQELLAILLRTGTAQMSAVGLAENLLSRYGGLRGVASLNADELGRIHGIGPAKAAQIKAAIEFGRRLVASSPDERAKIRSPQDVYNLIGPGLRYEKREHFVALLLDTKNGVMRQRTISIGDLSSSIVNPREVFTEAVRHSAASMIVAHNHPSGDPAPSPEDVAVTRRLVDAGTLLDIAVLDHIILGDNRWVSLKEKGLM